jgi:hypothetical protein
LGAALRTIAAATPVAFRDSASLLHLFCIDASGALWTSGHVPSTSGCGTWTAVGAPFGVSLTALAVAQNANGCLAVVAVGTEQTVYDISQTAPDGNWGSWSSLEETVTSLAVAQDANGCLTVVALGTDQALHYISQTAANNGWGSWSSVGAPAAGATLVSPAIMSSDNGALEIFVFAQNTNPALWTIVQDSGSTTGWGNWLPLGAAQPLAWSPVSTAPVLQQVPSGAANDCWAIDNHGAIAHYNGSQWTTALLRGDSQAAAVSVGTDGAVWAVTAANTDTSGAPTNACYRYLNGTWQQTGGTSFAQAPAGRASALWSLTLAGEMNRSTNGGATWWQDTGFRSAAQQLAVASDGTVWALDASGSASVNPGWQRIMRPTGMSGWLPNTSQCTAVAAGRDENGVRYVFFTNQAGSSITVSRSFRTPGSILRCLRAPSRTSGSRTSRTPGS